MANRIGLSSVLLLIGAFACGDDDGGPTDSGATDGSVVDGGGDDGGSADGGARPGCPQLAEPQLQVTYPGPVALTDASQTIVAGRVAAALDVVAVTVGGVAAVAVDGSDLHAWRTAAPIALALGSNVVSITAELGDGSTVTASMQVSRTPIVAGIRDVHPDGDRVLVLGTRHFVAVEGGTTSLLATPIDGGNFTSGRIAFDAVGRTAYLTHSSNRILAVNVDTLETRVLVTVGAGLGPDLESPRELLFDAANGRLIGASNTGDLIAVDPTSGERQMLSPNTETPAFTFPGRMVIATDDRIYATDADARLLVIDPSDGSRATLTLDMDIRPAGVAWDSMRSRLLVADQVADRVYAVDPASGTVELLFQTDPEERFVGGGESVSDLVYDAAADRVIAADATDDRVFAVDLSGSVPPESRTQVDLVTDQRLGGGPPVLLGDSLRFRNGRQLLVAEQIEDRLLSVDLETGERCLAVDRSDSFLNPYDLELIGDGAAALVSLQSALVRADLNSGEVTLVSGELTFSTGSEGSGPAILDDGASFAHDVEGNRVLIPGRVGENAMLAIDLADGERTVISAIVDPPFENPGAVLLDDDDDARVLVLDRNREELVAIALADGARSTLSDGDSTGPRLFNAEAMDWASPDSVYVGVRNGIVRLDLTTGARELVSGTAGGESVGTGPMLRRSPTAVRYDAAADRILIAGDGLGAVLTVDPSTGDRAIVSR